MERCPSCRARRDEGEQCRRCGMDLAHLLAAEQAAERLVADAIQRLFADDLDAAIDGLSRARTLVADPLADRLLAFARAEQRDRMGVHLRAVAQALGYRGDSVAPSGHLGSNGD